jgi:putative nucleotidyltransferase with HDIG domain
MLSRQAVATFGRWQLATTVSSASAGEASIDPISREQQRVFRWINGNAFNWGPSIGSIDAAAMVVGQGRWQSLVGLSHLRNWYEPDVGLGAYHRSSLWRHSVAVGYVAELIARVCDAADPLETFLAGVLHDIGLLALERLKRDAFTQLLDGIDGLTPTTRWEQHQWGWDHQGLGAMILKQWELSPAIVDAARYHHHPHQVDPRSPQAPVVWCVALANYFCSRQGWTSLGVHNVAPPPDDLFGWLGIDRATLRALWAHAYPWMEASTGIGA